MNPFKKDICHYVLEVKHLSLFSPREQESSLNKTPVGFRCNFCIEMHPTLRAICNHLRKHVQYGEVKEGHVKVNYL